MKRTAVVFVGAILAVFILAGISFAAEKLAYVDLSRLFGEYSKTKDFDKVLTDKQDAYTAERDKKLAEVKQLKDKMDLLSDKEKEAKKGEFESKVQAFQDYDRAKQTDLRKEQDEKMKEILKDIEGAVKQYSEKEGYTMVFNDRVMVYQSKTLEITEPILTILNKGKK
jgi:Skp family chaperone for outer membrane proteins